MSKLAKYTSTKQSTYFIIVVCKTFSENKIGQFKINNLSLISNNCLNQK